MIPTSDEEIRLGRAYANGLLLLANVTVFALSVLKPYYLVSGASSHEDVIRALGMYPIYMVNGERLWSIFSSMFLHADIAHLLGNMLFLYVFGNNIEYVMGSLRYLLFYLLSGISAAIFHVVSISLLPPDALLNEAFAEANPWVVPAVGASGAISGVLGAYLLLYPRGMISAVSFVFLFPIIIKVPAFVFIGAWFLYQLAMGFITLTGMSTGIAFWAHVGGFVSGIALLPFFVNRRRVRMLKMLAYLRGLY